MVEGDCGGSATCRQQRGVSCHEVVRGSATRLGTPGGKNCQNIGQAIGTRFICPHRPTGYPAFRQYKCCVLWPSTLPSRTPNQVTADRSQDAEKLRILKWWSRSWVG